MTSASEIQNGMCTYEFITKDKKIVSISIEDTEENPRFKIQGPKELIHKVIGGIGFETEDNTETIATEVHLNTEAKRIYAVLEVIKLITTK
jgi:hypothetical protein